MGSGDRKIAAMKSGTSSSRPSGSSKMITPREYNAQAEAQKEQQQAQHTTTGNSPSQRSVTGLDMLNPNNPADNAVIQQRVQAQQHQPIVSKGSSSASPKIISGPVREYPAPYSPDYAQKVEMGKLASGIQPQKTATELRRELVQSETGTTVSYVPGQPTTAERLRQEEQKEGRSAMDLGKYESSAARYEGGVESALDPLTSSQYKSARFVGGVAEAIAYTPTAVPRLAKGLATNPAATVRETILGTSETVIADPARGVGQLAGMVIAGKAGGKALGAVKEATPSIRVASASQELLVKVRVPEAPEVVSQAPKAVVDPLANMKRVEPYNFVEINKRAPDTSLTTLDKGAMPKSKPSGMSIDDIQRLYDNAAKRESGAFDVDIPGRTTSTRQGIPRSEAKGLPEGSTFEGFRTGNIAPEIPKSNILLGETKSGFTDVYFKVDKVTALEMSRKYTGNVENIRSPQGSFVAFEPTGKIDPAVFQKSGAARLPKPAEQIGNLPDKPVRPFGAEPSGDLFRIEKKVNLQEGSLTVSAMEQLRLPEFTRTVDAKGKVVNDFNIRDFYKPPEFEKPLQLESGLVKQKRNLFADTTAELKPGLKYKEKPTIIGNMPEMQTRYVNVERPLAMKDPLKNDMSHMQKLYDNAAKQGKDPIPTIDSISKVRTKRFPGQSRSPAPVVIPSILPRGTPSPKGKADPALSKYPSPIPAKVPSIDKAPKDNFRMKTAGIGKTALSFPEIKNVRASTALPIPKLPVPKISETRKKRKSKKQSQDESDWNYDRIVNKYNNPFNFKGW